MLYAFDDAPVGVREWFGQVDVTDLAANCRLRARFPRSWVRLLLLHCYVCITWFKVNGSFFR